MTVYINVQGSNKSVAVLRVFDLAIPVAIQIIVPFIPHKIIS